MVDQDFSSHPTSALPSPITRIPGFTPTAKPKTTTEVQRRTALLKPRDDLFVTFSGGFKDGRGLGNQLFDIAAAVYVAALSGRTFVMEPVNFTQMVDDAFDFNSVRRISELCPCFNYSERRALAYDPEVEDLGQPGQPSADSRTIFMGGFYQSWKYTRNIESRLRNLLQFKPNVREFAEKFLSNNFPPGWTKAFVRVAIHIRRGDNLMPDKEAFGYTLPNASYFQNAMKYFVTNYGRTQFIAVSQDVEWTRENVVAPENLLPGEINLTYAFGNSPGQDMALMSICDHVIMSTGTFGWWAGFLAKGVTVYFSDWPRKGSDLYNMFDKRDFFPPSWIGMDNIQITI